LNAESGPKGLCDVNDLRKVLGRAEGGDARARLALDVACYRLRKYSSAYWAAMGRRDAIVLTGGIGETPPGFGRAPAPDSRGWAWCWTRP
jgi:acetate kinase